MPAETASLNEPRHVIGLWVDNVMLFSNHSSSSILQVIIKTVTDTFCLAETDHSFSIFILAHQVNKSAGEFFCTNVGALALKKNHGNGNDKYGINVDPALAHPRYSSAMSVLIKMSIVLVSNLYDPIRQV